jgi:hypothetical protein
MLENQENNSEPTTAVELTVEEKLQATVIFPHNYLEVADAPVKPMLDALGLEVKGVGWYGSEPTAEQVTIRQEFVKLNKLVRETSSSLDQRRGEVSDLKSKVSELEEYLDENWDSIDEEVRDKLCDIFGIEGEVTKTIKITVSGTVEITAPRGYDWDNIGDDIDLNCETIINNNELTESGYGFSHDDTEVEEY